MDEMLSAPEIDEILHIEADHDCAGVGEHHICVKIVAIAGHMLQSLRIGSVLLMTNNPRKASELARLGVTIAGRVPHVIPPNEYNRFYLETKRLKSGHLLDAIESQRMLEQGEPVQIG